jgi:heterodisulfide reductase subunit A2
MQEPIHSWQEVEKLARNKKKILVVDDDELITDIIASMLSSEGYFVETATSGDAAFDLYCRYLSEGQVFDFVLMGLAQPGMNGIDLVEAIRKKRPDQRVGFSTAFPVLLRPFEKSELLAFVRQG